MKFRYLFLLILIAFLSLVGINSVSATCYKITDPSGNVSYNVSYDSWMMGTYQIEITDASNCTNLRNQLVRNQTAKNYDKNNVVSCGDGLITDMPALIPRVIHIIYLIIELLVPILLAIFGTIDFLKAVTGGKDEDTKKNQHMFLKRIIISIFVFFTFAFAKIVVSFGSDNKTNVISCASCIINNNEDCIKGA